MSGDYAAVMRVVLETEPATSIALGTDSGSLRILEQLAGSSAEARAAAGNVFSTLARHASSVVRATAAASEVLDQPALGHLAADDNIDVLLALANSQQGRAWLNADQLLRMVGLDQRLAVEVAQHFDEYEVADMATLCDVLARHHDPLVRSSLAGNESLPRAIRTVLTHDADPEVWRALASSSRSNAESVPGSDETECTVVIRFARWLELRCGALPHGAVDAIVAGGDFDRVIGKTFGAQPTDLKGLLPSAEWVGYGDRLEALVNEARRHGFRTECSWRGASLDPLVRIVLLPKASGLGTNDGMVCELDALRPLLSPGAFDEIAARFSLAAECQDALDDAVSNPDAQDRCLWVVSDAWKGCYAEAKRRWHGDSPPPVAIIFFATTGILPRGAELITQHGQPARVTGAQERFHMYLAAIVIGADAVRHWLTENEDKGMERVIVDYAGTPTMRYRR